MLSVVCVAKNTIHELFYEKFFYLIIFFILSSLGLCIFVGNLTYTEQSKLTLDFMLGAIHLSLILFSIFVGISLIQREFITGSVYLVLAKPLPRALFLLGKFVGQALVQLIVAFMMILITIGVQYFLGDSTKWLAIAQAGTLMFLESLIVTAIVYFFITISGSILTSVATLTLVGLGHFRFDLILSKEAHPAWSIWTMVRSLIPDLEILNLKNLAAYGFYLNLSQFSLAMGYGLLMVVFFLVIAFICFEHKDLGPL